MAFFSLDFWLLRVLAIVGLSSIWNPLVAQERSLLNKVNGLEHTGAVHFYLVSGVTEINLFKNDKIGYNPTNQIMRIYLVGPDGSVHNSTILKGNAHKQFIVNVDKEGVYTLFASMNNDQQMKTTTWGFQTNAPLYMINAGAGHTDAKRLEPIVLNGDTSGVFGVFFKPSKQKFKIKVTGLPEGKEGIEVYNGKGQLSQRFFSDKGVAETTIDEEVNDGVWELRLPRQQGIILIEGLTHDWEDERRALPVWTTDRRYHFDVGNYHWLISHRRFSRNVRSGDSGMFTISLFNNSKEQMSLEVSCENLPQVGMYKLSAKNLLLDPNTIEEVELYYELPIGMHRGYHDFNIMVRDLFNSMSAYALIELRVDTVEKISLPIQLKLFEHDQFQFAFEPDFPIDNQLYFDVDNRPWVVTNAGVKVLKDDIWEQVKLPIEKETVIYQTSTLGTDKEGYVYAIVDIDRIPYFLRVKSDNLTPEMIPLPVGGRYKIETYMGGKESNYPPVILRYHADRTKSPIGRWARKNSLELFVTSVNGGKLTISEPVLINDNCVGISDHSGITNAAFADDKLVHVIWGEVSMDKKERGVPTYTRTYDREKGSLSHPTLLAYAPPLNDVHSVSSLLIDNEGVRHVIVGAHGRPFQYLSHEGNGGDWKPPVNITNSGQTYVGAVLDETNGISLFGRIWRKPSDGYADVIDAALSYQYMDKKNRWSTSIFALPPLSGYSVYYHRVTVDRLGRVYLSMTYWSTWSPYRDSFFTVGDLKDKGKERIVFVSEDGEEFRLLDNEYLLKGIRDMR